MDNDWAYNEVWTARLWDERCRNSVCRACQLLAENAGLSLSRTLGSLRKSISRIFHHEKTTPQDLLAGHIGATSVRCQNVPWVLIASDTSFFNFTSHSALEGLGPIGDGNARGFLVHSALAIDPEGIPLGVLSQKSWVREEAQKGQAKQRRKRNFQDKESAKWLTALRDVENALPEGTRALLIQDREADVFDFFAAQRRPGIDLLIRVAQAHRVVIIGDQRSNVYDAVMAAPVETTLSVTVGAKPGQKEREASLSIRRVWVQVCPPHNAVGPKPAPIGLWVVAATEATPPEGVEAIEWILLTTCAVPDAATASLLVGYYARRWLIERFHYVLKSGLGFERLQVDTLVGLQKALSLFTIVAWRLLFLLYLARNKPHAPAEAAVSFLEKQVLEQMQGQPLDTVAEVVMAVARLAGFRPVPSAAVPGVKSLWLGWRKLADVLVGYQLALSRPSP